MNLKPYPHQLEALERMRGKKAFALLMAMRTGKSKVICDEFGEMITSGEAQDLLLIAPAGVYRTWEGEFAKQWTDDLLRSTLFYTWQSGAGKGQLRALEHFLHIPGLNLHEYPPRVMLVNVEALSTVDVARTSCVKFLKQRKSVCVIDESTTIRNYASRRTKFIIKHLRPLASYRRILSGLPTPRSPLDLYSQFEFLDHKILEQPSYWTFRRRYGVLERKWFGGRSVDVVIGYQNVGELQALIKPHSIRVTLEEVRDAIPPVYKRWEVELTDEQERLYRKIKETATAEISAGAHVTATVVIAQILRLHQVLCGHVTDEEGKVHDIPERRTPAILDILSDYDGKAIIWAAFDHSVRSISTALTKEFGEGSVARFWGGNFATREEEERGFKSSPSCRFIVATQAAGGRGRTWDMADLHIFHSNSWDLEHRDQAEQRAEGVTKTVSATRVDLIAPGTVDERIIASLRAKIDLAAAVTGDKWREWLV